MTRNVVRLLTSNYNKAKLRSASAQQLVNFYLEEYPAGTSTSPNVAALPTPGHTVWKTITGTQCRPGGALQHKGVLYVVVDATVYSVNTTTLVATSLGTMTGSIGHVIIGAIDDEIVFCDVPSGECWSWKVTAATWSLITKAQFTISAVQYPVISVVGFNGYFLFLLQNSKYIMVSNLNDGRTVGALSYFSANTFYDNIIAIAASETFIYLFSDIALEVWFLSGGQTIPFDRVSGGVVQYGILSPYAYALVQDNIVFMATDQNGFLGPMILNGINRQAMPNSDLVNKINSYTNNLNCYSYTDNIDGHTIFNTTFPLTDSITGKTWSIDISTGNWFQRQSYNNNAVFKPAQDIYVASWHVYIAGLHLIGDYYSGKIFKQSNSVYTENGTTITRIITSPMITDNGNFMSFYTTEIEVERSQGLESGQGSNPQIVYQYSKDRNQTWSNEIWRSASVLGQTKSRIRIGSSGGGRSMTHRFTFSDPIYWAVYDITTHIEREDPTYGRMIGLE